MKSNIKSLGWFIRFVPPSNELSRFYQKTLEFPFVRAGDTQAVDFFWAGEALILELIYVDGKAPQAEPDPETATLVPYYRVHELEAVISRYEQKGVNVIAARDHYHGKQAFLVDPNGQLIGLRERYKHSALAHDQEARRRRERGEAFNPGCAHMPEGVQELGWVVRRVQDLKKQARFYRDVVGLPLIGEEYGHCLFELGDNVVLELAPGGHVHELPKNRTDEPNTIILRLHQVRPMLDKLKKNNVPIVHDLIQWDRGALSYFADPEGNLVGIEEKYHPSRYAPDQVPFSEDLEAERRWRELPGPITF